MNTTPNRGYRAGEDSEVDPIDALNDLAADVDADVAAIEARVTASQNALAVGIDATVSLGDKILTFRKGVLTAVADTP